MTIFLEYLLNFIIIDRVHLVHCICIPTLMVEMATEKFVRSIFKAYREHCHRMVQVTF